MTSMPEKLRKRVVLERYPVAIQLACERAGTDIADGADFEGDAAIGEQVHERRILDSSDTVANALDAKNFDGFADSFRAADFAGVNQAMQAVCGSGCVNWQEIFGGYAEFVAANPKGNDF